MTDAETELAGFFANYSPTIAELGKALRKKLRARLPGLHEVVYFYERQHSLVIAYSPTGRGHDGVCSLALGPDQVKLYLARGPELSKADPNKLLQGSGKVVRYLPMSAAQDLDRAEVRALLDAAVELAGLRPKAGSKGDVVIKAGEQRQRAARKKPAARRAASSKRTRPRG